MSTQSSGFDLNSAPPVAKLEDAGITVEIKDLNGELMLFTKDEGAKPQPVTITVAGTYSETYRRLSEAQTTRAINRRTSKVTGELLTKQRLEVVAGCVLAWEGFHVQGKALPCDRETVKTVFLRAPWIREQVEAAMEDHEAFFEKNSAS